MSLIVRNKQWVATDDRYVKLDNQYAEFTSGKKLFEHPSSQILLAPLGDKCPDDICNEILHLAHNTLSIFFKGSENGVEQKPIGIAINGVCNYIEDIYNKYKLDTIFYLFLREMSIEISKTKTPSGVSLVYCSEIYDDEFVIGSGVDAYSAAYRLGCTLEQAFRYANKTVPTVGGGIQKYPVRGIRPFGLGVNRENNKSFSS